MTMNRALMTIVLLGCAAAAAEPVKLIADLTDGSCLVGVPSERDLSVATSVGSMTIPLKRVVRIDFSGEGGRSVLSLANGDRLSGGLAVESIGMETLLGSVRIDRALLRRLSVVSGVGMMPMGVREGLLLHYVFDRDPGDTIRDRSEHDVAGKVYGASWTADPVMGGALVFKGGDSRVEFPAARFPAGPAPRTLAAWVYQDTVKGGRYYVAGYGGDPSGTEFRLSLNEFSPGQLSLETGMGGWHAGATLEPQRWYHLVVSCGGGGGPRFYVNGSDVPVAGSFLSPALRTVAGGGTLGMRGSNEGGGYLSGKIAEVAVWNRELTPADVKVLYEARPGAADARASGP